MLRSQEREWQAAMHNGAEQLVLDLEIGSHAEQCMRSNGLIGMVVVKYEYPMGTRLAHERRKTRNIGEQQLHGFQKGWAEHILSELMRTPSRNK